MFVWKKADFIGIMQEQLIELQSNRASSPLVGMVVQRVRFQVRRLISLGTPDSTMKSVLN